MSKCDNGPRRRRGHLSSIEREIHLSLHLQLLRRRLVLQHSSARMCNIGGCSGGGSKCRSGRRARLVLRRRLMLMSRRSVRLHGVRRRSAAGSIGHRRGRRPASTRSGIASGGRLVFVRLGAGGRAHVPVRLGRQRGGTEGHETQRQTREALKSARLISNAHCSAASQSLPGVLHLQLISVPRRSVLARAPVLTPSVHAHSGVESVALAAGVAGQGVAHLPRPLRRDVGRDARRGGGGGG